MIYPLKRKIRLKISSSVKVVAVNSLLSDKDKRKELNNNARRVAENQNVKNAVDVIEDVYRKVLSQEEQGIQ